MASEDVSLLRAKDAFDQWTKLIDGARDKGEEFFELVIKHLEGLGVSGLTWEYNVFAEDVGLTGKIKGQSRTFLVIDGRKPFKILVGARNYGRYLVITRIHWMNHFKEDDTRQYYNYFEGERANLFASVVNIAVLDALQDLQAGIGQEGQDVDEVLKAW